MDYSWNVPKLCLLVIDAVIGVYTELWEQLIYYAKEYMGKLKKNGTEVNFLTAVTMLEIPIQIPYNCINFSTCHRFN
jgi:hypothetical protein